MALPTGTASFTLGQTVLVERDDDGGERIPMEYRIYISPGTYVYKAIIHALKSDCSYHRVRPLPWSGDAIITGTRKAYKTKIHNYNRLGYFT
jgi:hypothetical protein